MLGGFRSHYFSSTQPALNVSCILPASRADSSLLQSPPGVAIHSWWIKISFWLPQESVECHLFWDPVNKRNPDSSRLLLWPGTCKHGICHTVIVIIHFCNCHSRSPWGQEIIMHCYATLCIFSIDWAVLLGPSSSGGPSFASPETFLG